MLTTSCSDGVMDEQQRPRPEGQQQKKGPPLEETIGQRRLEAAGMHCCEPGQPAAHNSSREIK